MLINKLTKENCDSDFSGSYVVSPSKLKTALSCTGSLTIIDKSQSKWSVEGVELHAEVEKAFLEYKSSGKITKFKEDFLNKYLKLIVTCYNKKDFSLFGVEAKVEERLFNYLVGGIADFVYLRNNILFIADLKTGFKVLSLEDMAQLHLLAILFVEKYKLKNIKLFKFMLCTRHGDIHQSLKLKDLMILKNKLIRKLNEPVEFNVSDACLSCYNLKKCKTVQTKVLDTLSNKHKLKVSELIKMKPLIEKYYKTLEDDIKEGFFKSGKLPEGVKIVEGLNYKKWIDETEMLSKPEFVETKTTVVSVSNALKKKLLGEKKKGDKTLPGEGVLWTYKKGQCKVVTSDAKGKAFEVRDSKKEIDKILTKEV